MKRSLVNITIDAIAAAVLLSMIATGIVLRFTLPPGSGRALAVWGLTRHEWGDLHFWLSLAAVAIVVLHLALHWAWVVSVVRRAVRGEDEGMGLARLRGLAAVATVLILGLALAGFWWTTVRSIERTGDVVRRGGGSPAEARERAGNSPNLRGSMTVAEAAAALGCSVQQVSDGVGLSRKVEENEHLGQLARERGLSMRELRERLEELAAAP